MIPHLSPVANRRTWAEDVGFPSPEWTFLQGSAGGEKKEEEKKPFLNMVSSVSDLLMKQMLYNIWGRKENPLQSRVWAGICVPETLRSGWNRCRFKISADDSRAASPAPLCGGACSRLSAATVWAPRRPPQVVDAPEIWRPGLTA